MPIPTVQDLCAPEAPTTQCAAASVFNSLLGLTEVLRCFLEYAYRVKKDCQDVNPSTVDLEFRMAQWEELLSDDIRRLVVPGTVLDFPGAANLRLAYLSVRLLLRRIQLDLCNGTSQTGEWSDSPSHLLIQGAAEDIVHFVQELEETHCRGFWIPANVFALMSVTLCLLRGALRSRNSSRKTPLNIARTMMYSEIRFIHQVL